MTTPAIEVDFSEWKMREYRRFSKAVREGDIDAVFELAAQTVRSLPSGADPSNIDTYDNMTPDEWAEVATAVNKGLTERFLKGGN